MRIYILYFDLSGQDKEMQRYITGARIASY